MNERRHDLASADIDKALPAAPSDGTTVTEVIDHYRAHGFATDFAGEEPHSLRCGSCSSVVDARRVAMHSVRRMEGASDPADMVAVVAVTCPACNARGTVVLGYGPMASAVDADILTSLQDRLDDDLLPPHSAPS